MNRIIFSLSILLLFSVTFAACGQSVSLNIPAVVGENGDIVNVTMSSVPGNGDIYVDVSPRTGTSTQESIEHAVLYGYALSGSKPECNVLVKFDAAQKTNFIDGPSAGAALTALAYSLLTGQTLRQDTIITGTIDLNGNVGPVGGLYEKAKGAAAIGSRYFIAPVDNLYEMLLLKGMQEKYNITILQAQKISDVVGFMVNGTSIPQTDLSTQNRAIPNLPQYSMSSQISDFAPVANDMLAIENSTLSKLDQSTSEGQRIAGFFENELKRQTSILGNGYLFSTANDAFLDYIDLSTISIIMQGDVDLAKKKSEAESCLASVGRPTLTQNNFEWIIGSDLREAWAGDKLNSVNTDEKLLVEDKFVKYNDLMYADAWCHVATALTVHAPVAGVGAQFDESKWEPLAKSELDEANSIGGLSTDSSSRLKIAGDSYSAKKYGAAIYDAVYVISSEAAASNLKNLSSDNASELVKSALSETRSSLWGKIYQSHAAFLFVQNQTAAAYRTELFAMGLDSVAAKMMKLQISNATPDNGGTNSTDTQSPNLQSSVCTAAVLFLFISAVILIARRLNGDHVKRPVKAYRTKQKVR